MGVIAEEFNTGKANRDLIMAPTSQNAANLAPHYIENLRLSYSKRMAKAMIDGYFVPLEGAVFDALDPEFWQSEHVVQDYDPEAHRHCKTYLAVDPGFRSSAWIWIHEVAPLDFVVFDEIMPEDTSDAACIEAVNGRGWPIDEIWSDPAAGATQSTLNLSTLDMMNAIKVRGRSRGRGVDAVRFIAGAFRSIPFGVERLRVLLGDQDIGLPIRVRFAGRLEGAERRSKRGIVKDLMALTYPQAKPGVKLDHPIKDGITDHSTDALRYWAVGMWLTTDLYNLDPVIAQMAGNKPGYRHAA